MGTRGSLTGSGHELRWKYFTELPRREVDDQPTPDRSYNREEIPWVEEQWKASEHTGPGLAAFYLDLYETLCHGKPLVITPESVRRNVEIIAECHERHPHP
jgi:hypothetical protein